MSRSRTPSSGCPFVSLSYWYGIVQVLLFSYSTNLLDILESYVSSQGYTYRRLDGNTRMDIR